MDNLFDLSFSNRVKVFCPWCGAEQEFFNNSSSICKNCKKRVEIEYGKVIISDSELPHCPEKALFLLLEQCKKTKDHRLALRISKLGNISDDLLFETARFLAENEYTSEYAADIIFKLADKKHYKALKDIVWQYSTNFMPELFGYVRFIKRDIKEYLKFLAEDYSDKEAATELKKLEERERKHKEDVEKENREWEAYLAGETIVSATPPPSSYEYHAPSNPTFNGMEYTSFKSCVDSRPIFRDTDGNMVDANGVKQEPWDIYFSSDN